MQADTYPDDWRPAQADGPVDLVVNGELFQVSIRADGGYSSRWVSGPNPGYGFDSSAPCVAWNSGDGLPPAPLPLPLPTIAEHRESITEFLSDIDPLTGYLRE
ncbi:MULTISPECIES: hypothetical protein [Gordonia]|uniref:Uncharacterized protein n=1 Tax=Gordonia terrae C-6 TaxID=1316928 RepID=R7Y9V8_9ACTN|nr:MULTISPECIES: hypothetical protein [Gordonia]EON32777.1 hypothetical protein GTC6_10471 [Gordonia terrae C-6]